MVSLLGHHADETYAKIGFRENLRHCRVCRSFGRPDIDEVLDTPLREWYARTLEEIEHTPTLRKLYADELEAIG